MADSFLTTIDVALKARLFYKIKRHLDILSVNDDCVVWPKEYALRKVSEKRGNDLVEFFNLWRTSSRKAPERERTSVAIGGFNLARSNGTGCTNYRLIPMDLSYSFWVWSEFKNKLNLLEEQFYFWSYKNPKLDMKLDGLYNLNMDIFPVSSSYETTDPFNKGLVHILQGNLVLEAWVIDPDTYTQENVPQIERILLNLEESTNAPNYVEIFNGVVIEGKQKGLEESLQATDLVTKTQL